jgi:hypothetical protein
MTATPANWRVRVKRGDVLAVHATYDTSRASWYEAMAIMPLAATLRPVGGADPFTTNVDGPGVLTHGHLPENDHHGGGPTPYASASTLPDGPRPNEVDVTGFLYGQGDLSLRDARRDPPVVAPGELGFGPAFATPAANRITWSTPADLAPGTYAYFCRVHPFMRARSA